MSSSKDKFFKLLDDFDFAKKYWSKSRNEVDLDLIKSDLPLLSSGEASFVKFLAGVWLGRNELGFDYIGDMRKLKDSLLEAYQGWVKDPFYP